MIDGTERVEFETTLPLYAHGKLKLGTLLLGHVINSATQPPDACATVRDGYDLGNLMMFTSMSRLNGSTDNRFRR